MKFLLKIGIVAIISILGYNYFFGDTAEKEQARTIVNKVGDLGKSVKDLISDEKDKFDEGKYDKAVKQVGGLIASIREKASKIDVKEELEKLEKRKKQIEDLLGVMKNSEEEVSEEKREELDGELNNLYKLLEDLVEREKIE